MQFTLALIPIALILFLMIGYRWGAARSGGAGYLSALLVAILAFGAGPQLIAYAHAKAVFLTFDVLLIIWAAFLLYRVADEAGAIRTIGQALPHLTPDKELLASGLLGSVRLLEGKREILRISVDHRRENLLLYQLIIDR